MNTEELDRIAKELRINQAEIARVLGISRTAWYKKRKGITEVTLSEMRALSKFLRLTNAEIDVVFCLR